MILELVALAERLRSQKGTLVHDALKAEMVGIDCIIKENGEFVAFQSFDKLETLAEALTSKKGKARLLLDRCEEVLGIEGKGETKEGCTRKHSMFRQKLSEYQHLNEIKPVLAFYANDTAGIQRARQSFLDQVPEKKRIDNIAFRLNGRMARVHESSRVYQAVMEKYDKRALKGAGVKRCSLCGVDKYPVDDLPHGMIKRVPSGQSAGCALVSYNSSAFESYQLKGNNNSSICTHCAKAYVESLNWLMNNGHEDTSSGSKKPRFVYSNRKKIGPDAAFVFWLRDDVSTNLLDLLETPTVDSVRKLLDSPSGGLAGDNISANRFFGITLGGAAARITVRDWVEESVPIVESNLKRWFSNIAIFRLESDTPSCKLTFHGIPQLIHACRRETDSADQLSGRIGSILWRAALKCSPLPLWLLSAVLSRIKAEQGRLTSARASLIKLFLIRNGTINGENNYMEKLEEHMNAVPYLCGRLFAVLERLQYHAQGEVNAGIGERFFTSASSTPALAFGRLMKLAKQHLSKVKGEKPGLAVNIDKEIQEILTTVPAFPLTFRLEDQGLFALGYYHQKNSRAKE